MWEMCRGWNSCGVPARPTVGCSACTKNGTALRASVVVSVALAGLLTFSIVMTASAQDSQPASDSDAATESSDDQRTAPQPDVQHGVLGDGPDDPQNTLTAIQARRAERDSLLPVSPLYRFHDYTGRGEKALYDWISLQLGFAFTHAFQGITKAVEGEDQWGTASDFDIMGTWELLWRGKPAQGQLYFHLETRWNYGTTNPEDLGFVSLGALGGTANTFAQYDPVIILRNLYWQQGSKEAGWAYRIGKVTPDATLSTSAHISAITTFLPTGGTGPFANALPDSGLGVMAAWYPKEWIRLLGVVSDANADRTDFGDIGAGDFYYAAELGAQIAPRTEKAGYSKLTFWYTDGTEDGEPSNGMNGPSGWGFFLKLEQELTADGRLVGIARYGKSFNGSAFYDQQAGVHFLYYDPHVVGHIRNDVVGVAFNWVQPTVTGNLNEYNVEVFYRFPFFPGVDTTLSYQSVITPVLTPSISHASVFSLRLRTTF
jgi:hypothetical protein